MSKTTLAAAAAVALLGGPALAHHSGAIFYGDGAKPVTLTGQITEFRFRNPHAIIELTVTDENGEAQHWVGETSSPSVLRKRGWSQDTFTIGETLTIEGVQAADGSRLFRVLGVTRADGSTVGVSSRRDD